MSENTPETPKTSKFAAKLNSLKPSNLPDEKKATVVRRIQLAAAFASGVFLTVAAVNLKSFCDSFPATDEVEESEETTED